jgi:hypothetical protein
MNVTEGSAAVPPLFVIDRDGWLTIFDSVEAAQAHLEETDVEDHEYVGYDARGNLLSFHVEQSTTVPWWRRLRHQNPVRVGTRVGRQQDDALLRLLREALSRPEAKSVDELMSEVVARADELKSSRLSPSLTADVRKAAVG